MLASCGLVLFGGCGGAEASEKTDVATTPATVPSVEDTTTAGAPSVEDVEPGSTAAEITRALYVFYDDEDATQEEQGAAFVLAYHAAKDWIAETASPSGATDLTTARLVANVATMVDDTAGGWIGVDPARRFLDGWIEWLDRDESLSGTVGQELFASEVTSYAHFVSAFDGTQAGLALVSDATLDRIESTSSVDYRYALMSRAGFRRVLGNFDGAMSDLDESARLAVNTVVSPAEALSRAIQRLKLEIDLGRLDRAEAQLKVILGIAADNDLGATSQLRVTAYHLLFLSSAGRHGAVARLAAKALEADLETISRTRSGASLIDYVRALHAIGIGRSSDKPDELLQAEEELRAIVGPDSTTNLSVMKIASIECAAIALRRGEPARAAEALDQLEARVAATASSGIASRLYRTRLATRRLEIAVADETTSVEDLCAARERLYVEFKELLDSWSDLDDIPGGVGFLHFVERQDALSLLVQQYASVSDSQMARALDLVLEADARSTVARRLDAPPATAEDLISRCAEHGSAIVVLLPTLAKTHRFLVTAEGLSYSEEAGKRTLEGYSETVLDWLREPPQEGGRVKARFRRVREALEALALELVPEPILDDPSKFTAVEIVDGGMLGLVPFEVLPTETEDAIGVAVPVVRIPSAAAALEVERRSSDLERQDVSMFALSGSKHGAVGIDLTAKDLDRLRVATGSSLPFQSSVRATRDEFFRSMMEGSELFIAWTHGVTNIAATIPASLYVMTPPGATAPRPRTSGGLKLPNQIELLGGAEIDAVLRGSDGAAAPRGVFLAACDTALGHARAGDSSSSHLGGVFLGAGSEFVLIADRPVHRDAALLFLEEFCKAYFGPEKKTSGEAVHLARRALATSDDYASPHYWAALQLVGSGNTRER